MSSLPHITFCQICDTFGIESEEQFNALFAIAHQELDTKPAGTKWHRAEKEAEPHEGDITHREERLASSFLKIEGAPHVLMLGPGKEMLLGQSTLARVKIAVDKDKRLYAIKIFQPPRNLFQGELIRRHQAEHARACDLGLSHNPTFFRNSTVYGKKKIKLYSIQTYLGSTLFSLLSQPRRLSLISRLRLAIAICLQTDKLHQGKLSVSLQPYAHLDLKPDNITAHQSEDGSFDVHFIDFGSACALSANSENEEPQSYLGTPLYSPVSLEQMQDLQGIGSAAQAFLANNSAILCDLIALKRIIFLAAPFAEFDKQKAISVLNQAQFESLSQASQSMLSTLDPTTTAKTETPLLLASMLACELLHAQNKEQAHPLTERFKQQLEQSDEFKRAIIHQALTHLPAVTNQIEKDHGYTP